MHGASSGSNQFVFQSSSASISNMIAVAHQDANLPTEMSENTADNNLTQAMMMMGDQMMFNGSDGMFDVSSSVMNNSRIPGKISKLK